MAPRAPRAPSRPRVASRLMREPGGRPTTGLAALSAHGFPSLPISSPLLPSPPLSGRHFPWSQRMTPFDPLPATRLGDTLPLYLSLYSAQKGGQAHAAATHTICRYPAATNRQGIPQGRVIASSAAPLSPCPHLYAPHHPHRYLSHLAVCPEDCSTHREPSLRPRDSPHPSGYELANTTSLAPWGEVWLPSPRRGATGRGWERGPKPAAICGMPARPLHTRRSPLPAGSGAGGEVTQQHIDASPLPQIQSSVAYSVIHAARRRLRR